MVIDVGGEERRESRMARAGPEMPAPMMMTDLISGIVLVKLVQCNYEEYEDGKCKEGSKDVVVVFMDGEGTMRADPISR